MRPFHEDDLDIILSLYSSEEIMRYMPNDIMDMDHETDTAMIGWLLLKKDWGKGYATEMTRALLEYAKLRSER